MKKEELLKKINEIIPDNAEVVIFDHRKNLNDDCGDGSSAGIYKDFDVENYTPEEIEDGCIPFSALIFNNDDYDEDAVSVYHFTNVEIEEELNKKAKELGLDFCKPSEYALGWRHCAERFLR
jgi:hypothetical protein